MSWLFSRALVEEFSAATSSAGAASALSSGTPTPRAFLPPDRMTAFSRPSRFGMTFGPLTDELGEGLLTWFREASRARTSQLPAEAMDSTARGRGCGLRWHGSLARFDPASCSWRTAQLSLLGGSDESLENFPRWGTTRAGELFLLPTPELRTSGSGSGLWPTPCAQEPGWKVGGSLEIVDAKGNPPSSWNERWYDRKSGRVVQKGLTQVVQMWPTPTACMSKGSSPASLTRKTGASRENDRLDHKVMALNGGQLNPTWVEWLMGWPLGWTDLQPSATAKSLNAPPLRGAA